MGPRPLFAIVDFTTNSVSGPLQSWFEKKAEAWSGHPSPCFRRFARGNGGRYAAIIPAAAVALVPGSTSTNEPSVALSANAASGKGLRKFNLGPYQIVGVHGGAGAGSAAQSSSALVVPTSRHSPACKSRQEEIAVTRAGNQREPWRTT